MIQVEGLSKEYPGGAVAVSGVTFEARRGEILGVLGPNGAGKSTTMRMLTGYLTPTGGRATIAGLDLATDSLAIRRRLGYLPENVPLYPEMRVDEYLRYRAALKAVPPWRRAERLAQVAVECGLGDVRHRLIGQLSRGYRQRVGLADALVHEPSILLLDEPTVGLDPTQIREVRELIVRLGRERTVILSTHLLAEVEMVCDRVIILDRGALVATGTPAELRTRLRGAQTVRALVRGEATAVRAAVEKVEWMDSLETTAADGLVEVRLVSVPGHDVREELFRAVVAAGLSLVELGQSPASLEDVFVALTAHAGGRE
jgi:ABC-2 type transport system ATP-binding protein